MFNSTIENAFCCILAVARSMIIFIDGKLKRTMVKVLKHNEEFRKNVYNLDLQTCISYANSR